METRGRGGKKGKAPPKEPKPNEAPKPPRPDRRKAAQTVPEDRRRGDRRRDKRVPIELWIEEEAGDALYFQRAANLSAGGAFFAQTVPHAPGVVVNLRFTLPGEAEPIECRGEIVSALGGDGMGMGVRFVDIRPDDRKRIEELVDKVGT